MKHYEVELRRISYVVADVEGDNEEQAIEQAFEQLDVHKSDWKYWELSYCEQKEIL